MTRTEKEIRERLQSAMAEKGQDRPPFGSYEMGFCDALRWVLTASTESVTDHDPGYILRTAMNEAVNNGWGPS